MNTTQSPFFSVIITTFNRSQLVQRAITSLLKQSEKDWEAWIVDDGSTDSTENQLKSVIERFPRIHYIKQTNQGVIKAKNKGIYLSTGRYITFLDSDDEYKPTHLESRKRILEADPTLDFLHGGVEIIGNQYVVDCYHPEQQIHLSNCAISGTFFIRRVCMPVLKGFSGDNLNTDAEFFERVCQEALRYKKTDIATYVYHRDAGSSITNDMSKA